MNTELSELLKREAEYAEEHQDAPAEIASSGMTPARIHSDRYLSFVSHEGDVYRRSSDV